MIKKNDFIEINFTGKSNDKIFDTTKKEEAEELGVDPKNIKPLVISVGNLMILKGLDEQLEGKEVGKSYSMHLTPDKAFGKRDPSLIRTYSLNHFKKQNMNPYPGMAIQLDNTIARVLSVSGGRVTMDFNNPLAGKEIDYEVKVEKLITNNKEKINALLDFFVKQRFEFTIDEKLKKVIFKDEVVNTILQMLGTKFKDMTGYDFEVKVKTEKKKEEKEIKKPEKKTEDPEKKRNRKGKRRKEIRIELNA